MLTRRRPAYTLGRADCAAEGELGTNPFLADTDGAGTNDADDNAPTDPNTA